MSRFHRIIAILVSCCMLNACASLGMGGGSAAVPPPPPPQQQQQAGVPVAPAAPVEGGGTMYDELAGSPAGMVVLGVGTIIAGGLFLWGLGNWFGDL